MTRRVFISVGSNIDRRRNVVVAVEVLHREFGPIQSSSVYESDSVGFRGKPFYNLVVGFDTDRSMQELEERLKQIEHDSGRVRGPDPFVDRTLDLDIIVFGDFVADDAGIDVPSADILNYAFVLRPLAELAPDGVHPKLDVTYASLWNAFDADDQKLLQVDIEFD